MNFYDTETYVWDRMGLSVYAKDQPYTGFDMAKFSDSSVLLKLTVDRTGTGWTNGKWRFVRNGTTVCETSNNYYAGLNRFGYWCSLGWVPTKGYTYTVYFKHFESSSWVSLGSWTCDLDFN